MTEIVANGELILYKNLMAFPPIFRFKLKITPFVERKNLPKSILKAINNRKRLYVSNNTFLKWKMEISFRILCTVSIVILH